MSQLFTLQFPKYHFDKQREFTVTFKNLTSNVASLPFTYEIYEPDMVCVDIINAPTVTQKQDPSLYKERDNWTKLGFQQGVRIIKIGSKPIIRTDTSEKAETKEDSDLQNIESIYIDNLIKQQITDKHELDITFREEIFTDYDEDISLGLDTLEKYEDEHKRSKIASMLGCNKKIEEHQISASSCEHLFTPAQCRLNNSRACWKPEQRYLPLNNSWISIDLLQKQMVTKLRMQGSQKHTEYVKSLWIDYSKDHGTTWVCHDDGEIDLRYECMDGNEFGSDDCGEMCAEIIIWPAIVARFIRVRPGKYCGNIAVRLDLYGPRCHRAEFARVVKFGDLSDEDRSYANVKLKRCTMSTRLIQVDCKAVIRRALDDAHMSYVGFVETDKNNYLCVFSTVNLSATERTIEELMDIGIGRAMGVAGICPMQFRRPAKQDLVTKESTNKENVEHQNKLGITEGFYNSVKSRQIVDQLVDSTTQSAEFTYDYLSMLIVADVIAAMGLGTNSSVIVVASMLVSPIMGPVLALTFGVHLRKFSFARQLACLGFKNEVWSLLICILVGFVVGFILISITKNDPWGEWPWPTSEMTSRGKLAGLATGAIVAFASGVGVALSVVGDYVATVIGVAISASLLPPAVNCGMLWAMSVYVYIWPDRGCSCPPPDQDWGGHYQCCYTASELGFMGFISIVLTIENIILVFLASWMMFIIKDVALGDRDRAFDEMHRQSVYHSIASVKDKYEDRRMKMRSMSQLKKKSRKVSLKHLTLKGETWHSNLGRHKMNVLTVDTTQKDKNMKRKLMAWNTLRRVNNSNVMSEDGIRRATTEIDGTIESSDEEGYDDEYAGGRSKLRVIPTESPAGSDSLRILHENEPLVHTNKDGYAGVMEMTEDES